MKKHGKIEGFLEELHPASFGWAVACCRGNRDEALEVLQTSYLKAIDGRARFNGDSSPRTWFFGVVRRTAAEQRRYRLVRGEALRRWWAGTPVDDRVPSPERLSEKAEARERLRRMLSRLSARQQEILHLVFYQEMTIEEAADVLDVSLGTARTHYERGKRELRRLLTGAGDATWTNETVSTSS